MREYLIERVYGHGLCACGCGCATKVWDHGSPARGYAKGQHQAYVRGHQARNSRGSDLEALMERAYPDPNSGCFIWGGKTCDKGYGEIRILGRLLKAHRVAWELANGSIPEGMLICHKCDTRCCVNPDHLFLGDHLANAVDMARKDRGRRGDRGLPRGVSRQASGNYHACVSIRGSGRTRSLGTYRTVEEAAAVAAAARAELYGLKEAT